MKVMSFNKMSPSSHILIQFNRDNDGDIDLRKLKKLARAVCTEFDVPDVTVQIGLTDDAGIIDIHRQFLNKNNATDVISFDLSDEFEPARNFQIIVNVEMARRQAEKLAHSVEAELALYIVHGLLHLVGYDDCTPQQARRMHRKEDTILQNHRFGVIYRKRKTIG